MKPRLIRALIALAIGVLIVYVARNTYWEETTVPTPLRGEAVTNPFYAAQKLTAVLGAMPERRQTLGVLTDDADVLVLANWHWDLIDERREQIEAWVERGGRLVVGPTLIDETGFSEWSGVRWEYPAHDDKDGDDEDTAEEEASEEPVEPVEEGEPPTFPFQGTGELCGMLEQVDYDGMIRPGGRTLSVCKLDGYSFLATDRELAWGYAHEDVLQAARVSVGGGSVTVLNLSPFGNRDLTKLDHGKLFADATELRAGDRIVFLSESEHMSLLGLIWLYGAPVVVLALLLLAALLWRGGVRFGPLAAPTDTARRSLAEQIRGTGQFAMRLGDGKALHEAAVRALQEAARRRIARYESLSHADRIAAIAQKSGLEQEALATAINHRGARRATDLAHTIALLETARRRILE